MSKLKLIWISLACIYALFWSWYVGFNHQLHPAEADEIIASMRSSDLEINEQELRETIASDDGKDLIIVNLIRLKQPKQKSMEILDGYSRPFLKELFKRGGHPVMLARPAGRAVEYWGLEPGAEAWDMVVAVRYRSARDMFEMAAWPEFAEIHPLKKQSIEKTIALPSSPWALLGGLELIFALLLIIVGLCLSYINKQ